jgi:hypothetical protein
MLLDLVKQYPDVRQEVEVERFRVVRARYELRAVLVLQDGSRSRWRHGSLIERLLSG